MKMVCILALSCITLAFAPTGWTQNVTIENPGFEQPSLLDGAAEASAPDGWFLFCSSEKNLSGITDRKKRSGMQAFSFRALEELDSFTGLAQKFSCTPGDRYEIMAYVINDPRDPIVGEAFGQLSLEWQDENGKEISRNYGPTFNFEISPIRWQKFMVGAAAPEAHLVGKDASYGVAVITFYSKDSQGKGSFYIDDCKMVVEPKPVE